MLLYYQEEVSYTNNVGEDIKKGINIALSAYKDSGYMTYDDMYDNNLMDETVKGYLDTLK